MIISQVSIAPVGKGTSLSKYVRIVLDIFKKNNLNYKTNDMGTVIETKNLETLFNVVKQAHEAVIESGAERVITELKIDDRRDKDVRIGNKISAIQ
jgi:uncharacterized protein (TIGR00106 family)